MKNIDALREQLPEPAKDIKLNLQSVLKSELLTAHQTWSIAITCACFLRENTLRDAIVADARADGLPDAYLTDAQAAAALMGMNTAYYRFRHLVGKPGYAQRPARLRMQRMAQPATSKADFELMSLGCAVLAGCEVCIKAHEASILQHNLSEDHVLEAARIAAVIAGTAVAMHL